MRFLGSFDHSGNARLCSAPTEQLVTDHQMCGRTGFARPMTLQWVAELDARGGESEILARWRLRAVASGLHDFATTCR